MSSEKNSIALANFFSSLFKNFPKLLLTNLLFAIPFAVFGGIFQTINILTGINSNFVLFLTVIPLFPFYAGVTQVTSHMVRGEKDVNVLSNFIAGVKENFLRFLFHGVVLYAAIFFSYYSIVMYSSFGKYNGMFYCLLAFSIVVAVFFLFAFFYIPPMTVTFDISMKNIYKNSALMTFGELKHNIFATFGLLVIFLVCATILFCCYNAVAVIIATIILALFFVPSVISYVTNSAVYKTMYTMIVGKDEKIKTIDEKMENRKKGNFFDDKEKSSLTDSFSELEVDESRDGDEYIYYNGKMVKRSVLVKLKKDAEEKENN